MSEEEELQGEVMLSLEPVCFIDDTLSLESKVLGLFPEIYSEELAHNDVVLLDLVSDSGNACTFSEMDCNVENVFEVESVKLDMALI